MIVLVVCTMTITFLLLRAVVISVEISKANKIWLVAYQTLIKQITTILICKMVRLHLGPPHTLTPLTYNQLHLTLRWNFTISSQLQK